MTNNTHTMTTDHPPCERAATLPNKPSELIVLALADLIKCERSSKYAIAMDTGWHAPRSPSTCEVCLAGGVIAQTLGASPNDFKMPTCYKIGLQRKLDALDDFRCGRVGAGLMILRRTLAFQKIGYTLDRTITAYNISAAKFKREMRALARDFAKAGQ